MVLVRTSNGITIDHEKLSRKFYESSNLSEREAEAFVLTAVKDMDVKDASEVMGISPGTVSSYRERIREKIDRSEMLLNLRDMYDF